MKIAISSTGEGLDSQLSPVFGRCPYFVIVEIENNEIKSTKTIKNPAINQPGGAGMMAAQTVGNEGVKAVISGNLGPRAFGVLQQIGIEMYQCTNATVKEAADLFAQGKLQKISAPGAMGFGMGGGRGLGMGRGLGGGRRRQQQ